MKPERRTRRAAAVTLSKMYEYGVPEADHIALPDRIGPGDAIPHSGRNGGAFASEAVAKAIGRAYDMQTPRDEVIFSARVLETFDESRLNQDLSFNLRLLAAAGFYFGDVPGSAAVQISKLAHLEIPKDDPLALAAKAVMERPWDQSKDIVGLPRARAILEALSEHFKTGGGIDAAIAAIRELRSWAYASASAHELLMADLLGAVGATPHRELRMVLVAAI